jgi:purine-cytosine permease-like protein
VRFIDEIFNDNESKMIKLPLPRIGWIWFCLSGIALEFILGVSTASLGLREGLIAALAGHAIGFALLWLLGYIGINSGLSWSGLNAVSFGRLGSKGLACLNMLHVICWISIMIGAAGLIFDRLADVALGYQNRMMFTAFCGIAVLAISVIPRKTLRNVHKVLVILMMLSLLSICAALFGKAVPEGGPAFLKMNGRLSFSDAVELNVTMACSWGSFFIDYIRRTKKEPFVVTTCVAGYSAGSLLMFFAGLYAACKTGTEDYTRIIFDVIGWPGLIIIGASLLLRSAVDAAALASTVDGKGRIGQDLIAVIVIAISIVIPLLINWSLTFSAFYLLGAIASPAFAVIMADYLIFRRTAPGEGLDVFTVLVWCGGFTVYRIIMSHNVVMGYSMPTFAVTVAIYMVSVGIGGRRGWRENGRKSAPSS